MNRHHCSSGSGSPMRRVGHPGRDRQRENSTTITPIKHGLDRIDSPGVMLSCREYNSTVMACRPGCNSECCRERVSLAGWGEGSPVVVARKEACDRYKNVSTSLRGVFRNEQTDSETTN